MPENNIELKTTKENEENKIKLYSNEVQEIISNKPNWIIRNGIAFFLLIIVALITATFFISYPEIIKTPVRITGINTPKLLSAKTEGKLLELFVKNEQLVDSNQTIAVINSTSNYKEIKQLEQWIESIEKQILTDSIEILQVLPCPILTQLGDLQQPYQEVRTSVAQTLQILGNGYYQQKKEALLKDLGIITALQQNIKKQKLLLEKDYSLQEIDYKANESLAKDKVIAPLEFNREKAKLLSKQQSLEQMTANILNNTNINLNKKKEILELQKIVTDTKQAFQTILFSLKGRVIGWKDRFLITAPESGNIQFVSYLQTNQTIKSGQELFYLIPKQALYYAELIAPQQNFGKVKLNQQVIIRLNSYPYNEFGTLKGCVSYIPEVPFKDTAFLLNVQLDNGLKTTYNKTLLFKNNLVGNADIITEDLKLSDRFLYTFKQLVSR